MVLVLVEWEEQGVAMQAVNSAWFDFPVPAVGCCRPICALVYCWWVRRQR